MCGFVAELCFHVCLRGWAMWPSWLSRVLPVATLRALYPFSHQGHLESDTFRLL